MQAQKFMCLQIETVLILFTYSVNYSVIWLLKILCEVTAQIQSQRNRQNFCLQ